MHFMKNQSSRQRRNKKGQFGFTFIEIIIVMTMVTVISFAVYATFSNGVKIWQRVNSPLPLEDVNIFLGRFSSDLRNCLLFKSIEFFGSEDSLRFATLVKSSRDFPNSIGQISYLFDSGHKAAKRAKLDYSGVCNEAEGFVTQTLNNVASLKFKYYFYDKVKNEYLYTDEWQKKDGLPLAVKIEIELRALNINNKFSRTVTIPVSG
jgi:prepilin-type N-terminal cleavage/methylation domain-containing protein